MCFNNGDKVINKATKDTGVYVGLNPKDKGQAVWVSDVHGLLCHPLCCLTKVEWYHNIPTHGVLCWVKDHEKQDAHVSVVVRKSTHTYVTAQGSEWNHARPLTKGEIKVFMETCPDD